MTFPCISKWKGELARANPAKNAPITTEKPNITEIVIKIKHQAMAERNRSSADLAAAVKILDKT